MESLSNGAKRKKRKTRKCLDEIRKRSRCTGQISVDKNGRSDDINHKNILNCMITNNRLTLRMFPKVIQSKTITRPILIDLEHKPNLNLDELVTGTDVLYTEYTKRIRIPVSDTDNNDEFFQTGSHNSDDCERDNSMLENEKPSRHSNENNYEMYSSLDESSHKAPNSKDTPSSSSSSAPSLPEGSAYSLYEEFMAEVPACLQHNSKLIQEDVMKRTKMLLQNLFIESCYDECEDNIVKCIKSDTPRRGFYSRAPSSGSASPSPSASPAASPDTPDYVYYPHRLN